MTKYEKVLKGLCACAGTNNCDKCPYKGTGSIGKLCVDLLMYDAIALLKGGVQNDLSYHGQEQRTN